MKKYNVFFENDPLAGNPAVVIETEERPLTEFQQIAHDLKAPVTVFLMHSYNNVNPKVRFFYPNRETSICVHGALALACHLLQENPRPVTIINRDNQGLRLTKNSDQFFIDLSPVAIQPINLDKNEIYSILDITERDIEPSLPFEISSVGSPKLLIPVNSLEILKNLKPNFDKLSLWSQENTVNGFYIYTQDTFNKSANFHARNFNPLSGQNEDIATGVAAGSLALSLSRKFPTNSLKIEQGHFLNSPCLIYVHIQNNLIQVGGNCA